MINEQINLPVGDAMFFLSVDFNLSCCGEFEPKRVECEGYEFEGRAVYFRQPAVLPLLLDTHGADIERLCRAGMLDKEEDFFDVYKRGLEAGRALP